MIEKNAFPWKRVAATPKRVFKKHRAADTAFDELFNVQRNLAEKEGSGPIISQLRASNAMDSPDIRREFVRRSKGNYRDILRGNFKRSRQPENIAAKPVDIGIDQTLSKSGLRPRGRYR